MVVLDETLALFVGGSRLDLLRLIESAASEPDVIEVLASFALLGVFLLLEPPLDVEPDAVELLVILAFTF